jgi:hypothetical protein
MIYTKQKLEKFARRYRRLLIRHQLFSQLQLPFPNKVTTMAEDKVIPIEDLMDASIDDLQDLPPFEIPPVGHYKLNLSLTNKVVNDKPCIEAGFVVIETLELKDPGAAPAEAGTKFSQLFTMDNEFGQGGFKLFIKPIIDGLGLQGKRVSEILAAVQNVAIAATVKHRQDKKDKTKIYANVVNPEVV